MQGAVRKIISFLPSVWLSLEAQTREQRAGAGDGSVQLRSRPAVSLTDELPRKDNRCGGSTRSPEGLGAKEVNAGPAAAWWALPPALPVLHWERRGQLVGVLTCLLHKEKLKHIGSGIQSVARFL